MIYFHLVISEGEILQRLIQGAIRVPESGFSHHESILTNAMNVLESLTLQLGGYGAIGTMNILSEDGGTAEDKNHLIADETELIKNLPTLLGGFASLLRHPSTETWKSLMQYDRTTEQKLLGTSRLRIIRVLEALVLLGNPRVDECIIESGCFDTCLSLFWEFPWCFTESTAMFYTVRLVRPKVRLQSLAGFY